MAVTIGDMNERVTIQQNTTSTDTQGGRSSSWGTLATVWANVRALSGAEMLRAQAVTSQIRFVVTAYYRADVTAKMRMLWTPTRSSSSVQRTLEILAMRPAEDPLLMELDCGEQS